jgi:hypothetical protein
MHFGITIIGTSVSLLDMDQTNMEITACVTESFFVKTFR